eukprot:g1694.t1
MDTFVLLDRLTENFSLIEIVAPGLENVSWTGVVPIAKGILKGVASAASEATLTTRTTLSVEALRELAMFRAFENAGVDLCAIFDEEEVGSVSVGRMIYGITMMHVLSQDRTVSAKLTEEQTHDVMWMALVNASGVATSTTKEGKGETPDDFKVPAEDVRMWIESAACLGIVRGWEYLERGAIVAAEPCARRVFERWCESEGVRSATSDSDGAAMPALVSHDAFKALMSKVEYDMFWNRNKRTFRAIEFYRKQDRQVEHLRSIQERRTAARVVEGA